MPSSVSCGQSLVCLTTLLFLSAQVRPQCYIPRQRSLGHLRPSCCPKASNYTIKEPVDTCFEQKENTFVDCEIHAYILSNNNSAWCVDPRAQWLQKRLQKLQKREICCQIL